MEEKTRFSLLAMSIIRCGGVKMKRTYQPNQRKKAKKHGFFARKESNILKSRRKKGRKVLCK